MNRKQHSIINLITTTFFFLFVLWARHGAGVGYMLWALAKCMLWLGMSIYFGPDIDQADYLNLPHRSAWTHSILFPLAFTACLWGIPQTSAILVPYATHLLADLAPSKNGNRSGSWRVNGKWSTRRSAAWYTINGILGIVIAILLEVL